MEKFGFYFDPSIHIPSFRSHILKIGLKMTSLTHRNDLHESEESPFKAPARYVTSLPTKHISDMYRQKCSVDVRQFLGPLELVHLFECGVTGMQFWRPTSIAGDEQFYRVLSASWPDYYKSDRWKYTLTREVMGAGKRILEVGCGRGYFLRSLEGGNHTAVGLELNEDAIANTVTTFDVRKQMIEDAALAEPSSFDVVCSFQVLEHVTDPAAFIRDCVASLRPGGLLILSTPNHEFHVHSAREDAFDLPPHHLNHFIPDTFRRIAKLLNLELLDVFTQGIETQRKAVWVDPRKPLPTRLFRQGINLALRSIWGMETRPGHTLLAVLRVHRS